MSEPVPETPPQRSSGGSAFTRKLGPLPLWGWMAVLLAAALVYYFAKQKTSSNAANAVASGNGSVDSSQVPQFVNQTYVTATPPSAPDITGSAVTVPHGLQPAPMPVPVGVTPVAPNPVTPVVPVTPSGSAPITVPHSLTRSWTSPSTSWTIADIGKGLKLANPGSALQPSNSIAKTFMTSVYPKNHNAKVPKGAAFTYVASI